MRIFDRSRETPRNQPIALRVTVSLFANAGRASLSFFALLLLARGLTSAVYGDLMFLLGSFVASRALMDLGTTNAFFTFISQGKSRPSHYFLYFGWLAIQFILYCLFIVVVCPERLLNIIWLGHARYLVLLAFVASFFQQQCWKAIANIAESERKTVWNQIFGVSIALLNLLGIAMLQFFEFLTITNVLMLYIAIYSIVPSIAFFVLGADRYLFRSRIDFENIRCIFSDYVAYCYPLVFITVLGFVYNYLDTWILQYFGGSTQQGFYQIANQFASISLLATSSVLSIFWKEVAAAYDQNDQEKVKAIFLKATRGLVLFGAVISGFLVPWTDQIIRLLLGESYSNAVPILAIMFFYPIHQSMGQLAASFFFATKRTRIYSTVSTIVMLMSMPLSIVFLAPVDGFFFPGFGLGAVGLALKMVTVNVVGVNISIFIISRLQHWKYDYKHQFYVVTLTTSLGYVSYICAKIIITNTVASSISMCLLFRGVLSALIYLFSILGIIYYVPEIAGLSKLEAKNIGQRLMLLISKPSLPK